MPRLDLAPSPAPALAIHIHDFVLQGFINEVINTALASLRLPSRNFVSIFLYIRNTLYSTCYVEDRVVTMTTMNVASSKYQPSVTILDGEALHSQPF